jgi:trehalose 6-phosphate synthase
VVRLERQGRRERHARRGRAARQPGRPVTLAELDLSQEDHDAYYRGYANGVLWPVFHYRLDLAHFEAGHLGGYRRVNQLFARKLFPLLKRDDIVWIHDYHLIPLAAELRAMGCEARIGFFLHIPLPPPPILTAIPSHEWLMRALFAYDLVGFQNHADLQHFAQYVQAEATAEPVGPNQFRAFNRTVHANAFPIGIDVAEFQRLGQAKEARDTYESTKAEYSRRRLLIGWTGWIIPRACRSASAPSANCCACIRKIATAPPAADRLAQP